MCGDLAAEGRHGAISADQAQAEFGLASCDDDRSGLEIDGVVMSLSISL